LYCHYQLGNPHFLVGRSSSAMRKGDFKSIEFPGLGKLELCDIKTDPGESGDLLWEPPKTTFRG
jgi:hypothetical protein